MKAQTKNSFIYGLKDGVPIGLGYLSVSFAFGITAVSVGIPPFISMLISMTNLTSAGQIAGIGIMSAGGALIELIISQLVINMRYLLMSISLTQKIDKSFTLADRFIISFCNTDEIFAVASGKDSICKAYMYGLVLIPYFSWSLGTVVGALASGILPPSVMSALGITIYAMFTAIIIPPARKSRAVAIVVLISAALSCAFKYVPILDRVSSGTSVIICAVVAASLGAMLFPKNDIKEV